MYEVSRMDQAIAAVAPLYPACHVGNLPTLNNFCKRYIVACDGVHLESRNAHLHVAFNVAPSEQTLPYGMQQQFITLAHGLIPLALFNEAQRRAQTDAPKEWAGWIVWNDTANCYELREGCVISAGAAHVRYQLPDDLNNLIVDIHSHGHGDAYFSQVDNNDDRATGGLYFSMVLGQCHQVCMTHVMRINVDGSFFPIALTHYPFENQITNLEEKFV